MGITEEMTQQVATPTKNVPNMPQNGQISAPRPPQNRAPSQAASPQTPPRPGRAPNQPTLEHLLRMAFDRGYSDVHLGVGEKPRMRTILKLTSTLFIVGYGKS